LGIQAFKYMVIDSTDIWVKPLKNGDWAVCFLNRGKAAQKINFDWKKQIIVDELFNKNAELDKVDYKIRNVWTNTDAGNTKKPLQAEIPGHDVIMFRLVK
jgi:alpha-galactosidase